MSGRPSSASTTAAISANGTAGPSSRQPRNCAATSSPNNDGAEATSCPNFDERPAEVVEGAPHHAGRPRPVEPARPAGGDEVSAGGANGEARPEPPGPRRDGTGNATGLHRQER